MNVSFSDRGGERYPQSGLPFTSEDGSASCNPGGGDTCQSCVPGFSGPLPTPGMMVSDCAGSKSAALHGACLQFTDNFAEN